MLKCIHSIKIAHTIAAYYLDIAKLNMATSSSSTKQEFIVGGKYRLVRKIGSGSFGDIYLGINVTNGEVIVLQFDFSDVLWDSASVHGRVHACNFLFVKPKSVFRSKRHVVISLQSYTYRVMYGSHNPSGLFFYHRTMKFLRMDE